MRRDRRDSDRANRHQEEFREATAGENSNNRLCGDLLILMVSISFQRRLRCGPS